MRIAVVVVLVFACIAANGSARTLRVPPGRPGIAAYFTRRSYRPGELARLVVRGRRPAAIEIFEIGSAPAWSQAPDELTGTPVTRLISTNALGTRNGLLIRVGDWTSGLYFARLSGHGLIGYATLVVRPRHLGAARVAVVLPTNTWQAYNFRDDDGNGLGDTWYADPAMPTVNLERPFLDRGVPPHFKGYDYGFLAWLAQSGHQADFLTDDDLGRLPGERLAHLYDLIVFPGHTEYVTTTEFDAVARYRDLGGNLMFLSANNFFYRVVRRGETITRAGRWRDLGHPEANLIGAQYVDWNHDTYPNRPYVVTGVHKTPWLFRHTGLRDGDSFGTYGIEIDAPAVSSPSRVQVIATITDEFGPGKSADMTYYETADGAKVFDAGVINFGGTARSKPVSTMIENLWVHLSST